ncbi:MAG: T9SS type A sorting domain-containing protein, partial [Microbacteriaceae bacterium]|nr:T9SS type A sorting domain-containing protein [Microbacteriaceae bacterium]
SRVAALDPFTGAVHGWNPNVNGRVSALAATGSGIVIGGTFTQVRGKPRQNIALWDGLADSLSAWNPGANAWVTSLDATPGSVRVVGHFTTAGGQARSKAAEFDLGSGVPTAWNPSLSGDGYVVASDSGRAIVGGIFIQLYFQPRIGLAAVETSTGILTDWYPGAVLNGVGAGHIYDIVERNGVVYLGGSFTSIGGVSRRHLAAASAASGALLAGWDPQVGHSSTHYVNSISLGGSTLFVGGSFTTVNGPLPRGNLAELRLADGLATSWNPSVDGEVLQVVRQGSTLYLSGNFNMLSGAPREYLGAFDLSSGLTSSWAPQVNGYVRAILPSGGSVYVGGDFSQLGGLPRVDLGALDAVSGLPTSWVASTDGFGSVYALAPHLDGIIAAGSFVNIGGQPRNRAAFLHADGNVDPDWNPNVGSNYVYAISTAPDGGVYLGGGFQTVGGRPHANLARVSPATGLLDAPREFPLPSALELSVAPHPIVSRARLRFALPAAASVTASVFDAAGRRVVTILDRASLPAGAHSLGLDTRSLATGCYFIRVEAGGHVGTTRLVLSR